MGEGMIYRELSNRLAEFEEALGALRVNYKSSLVKRRELAELLFELSENSSSEEANIDALANEVEKMNDEKSNLRRELEARRTVEDKIREKEHEIFKLKQEVGTLTAYLQEEKEEKEELKANLDMAITKKSLTRLLIGESQSIQDETEEILKNFLGLGPEEEEPVRIKGEDLPDTLKIDDIITDEIVFDDSQVDTHTKKEIIIIIDKETVLPEDISISKDKDNGKEEKDKDVEEIKTKENVQIDDVQIVDPPEKEEMQKNIDVEQSTGQPVNTEEI
ncbi:uncharacterized protein LOC131069293 [Cryptomeria japonica]|uniref:uncharacterized protein LOC131069293 n=1 Tax=Cryptomeria japonica TaxID=3369 RepID=UPI0027DA7BFA|nr:uncharacterized protein LOC131069293 [Cryptomeria japonica]